MAFICLLKIALCDRLAWQHGWQQGHGEICLGSSSHCAQQSLALCSSHVVLFPFPCQSLECTLAASLCWGRACPGWVRNLGEMLL